MIENKDVSVDSFGNLTGIMKHEEKDVFKQKAPSGPIVYVEGSNTESVNSLLMKKMAALHFTFGLRDGGKFNVVIRP